MKLLGIGVGIFAIVALYLLTPLETKASLGESWRRMSGDPGQACFDFERANFNDSVTAKLQATSIRPESPNEVHIRFQAKNAFGAYRPGEAICVMKAGKVDAASTQIKRTMNTIDAGIKCLEEKIERRRSGQAVSSVPCPGE